jgi:hypothetical protein
MPPSTYSYNSEQTENQANNTKQNQPKVKSVAELNIDLEKYERKIKSAKVRARSGLSS